MSTGFAGTWGWLSTPAILWDAERSRRHGCHQEWTGQGRCPTGLDKCCQGSCVSLGCASCWWEHGPAVAHRGCASPQGYFRRWIPPSQQLLGGISCGKSCGKAFLHVSVQTGDQSITLGRGKVSGHVRAVTRLCAAGCISAPFGALRHLDVPQEGSDWVSRRSAQTASKLINVFLLLLFQGAKGLSASETNGKRRPWPASPSHNPMRPTQGESAAGEEKQRGTSKWSLAPSQPGWQDWRLVRDTGFVSLVLGLSHLRSLLALGTRAIVFAG